MNKRKKDKNRSYNSVNNEFKLDKVCRTLRTERSNRANNDENNVCRLLHPKTPYNIKIISAMLITIRIFLFPSSYRLLLQTFVVRPCVIFNSNVDALRIAYKHLLLIKYKMSLFSSFFCFIYLFFSFPSD